MPMTEQNVTDAISEFGRFVDAEREPVMVCSAADIDAHVQDNPGVYWIETTMPIATLKQAISREPRKKPPTGTELIYQDGAGFYVVYSGTEGKLRTRLRQHLLNEGNEKTVKLGAKIDQNPFIDYQWRISVHYISSYVESAHKA